MASMLNLLVAILRTVRSSLMSRDQLILENLTLRQQLAMLQQSVKRPRVSPADRLFWILFSKIFERWREMLHVLHPDTVVRWHRLGFRRYWTFKSRQCRVGRPPIDADFTSNRFEVYEASAKATLADLAGISHEPCRLFVFNRFLYGSDRNLSCSLCFHYPQS